MCVCVSDNCGEGRIGAGDSPIESCVSQIAQPIIYKKIHKMVKLEYYSIDGLFYMNSTIFEKLQISCNKEKENYYESNDI